MSARLRIGTRGSRLARAQTDLVGRALAAADPELAVPGALEPVVIRTTGDRVTDRPLAELGGKGLFCKELEAALLERRIDLAVHSMKDVPAEMPAGFCIAAVLPRASFADALLTRDGRRFAELPDAAVVGSSSLRRQAQMLALRSDLRVRPLRGNVNTRLAKLAEGEFDAIVLACAGLERLGLARHISERFDPEVMLPAAAQGVIGIECRDDNSELQEVLMQLDDAATRHTTIAERAVARHLRANCQSPVASLATLHGDDLTLLALVARPDGSLVLREEITGSQAEAAELGREVAERLLARGAGELLASGHT